MLMAEAIIPLWLHSWARLNKCSLFEVALPPSQVSPLPPCTSQQIISLSITTLYKQPSEPSCINHLFTHWHSRHRRSLFGLLENSHPCSPVMAIKPDLTSSVNNITLLFWEVCYGIKRQASGGYPNNCLKWPTEEILQCTEPSPNKVHNKQCRDHFVINEPKGFWFWKTDGVR